MFGTTIRLLRGAGFEVKLLRELAPTNSPDETVIRVATVESLVLLTNDQDFCNIVRYPPDSHAGVIVLRMAAGIEAEVHQVLLAMLADNPPVRLAKVLAIVSRGKYRLRR